MGANDLTKYEKNKETSIGNYCDYQRTTESLQPQKERLRQSDPGIVGIVGLGHRGVKQRRRK